MARRPAQPTPAPASPPGPGRRSGTSDPRPSPAPVPDGRRRRDRHGRGLRGPLVPRGVPAWRSRKDRFDDRVLDAVERLEQRWARELVGVEFAVEDVPPSDPAPWEHGEVPLGRLFPGEAQLAPRVVVYRRPVETRAGDPREVGPLVHEVVVEQVAQLLGLAPEDVDPGYRGE